MQNVLNTWKDSQANSEEKDMAKLLNNRDILTLDKESISNELLSKNLICSKSIEEQMTEFRKKKIMKNTCNRKITQQRNIHTTKMNPSFHPSV